MFYHIFLPINHFYFIIRPAVSAAAAATPLTVVNSIPPTAMATGGLTIHYTVVSAEISIILDDITTGVTLFCDVILFKPPLCAWTSPFNYLYMTKNIVRKE